MEIGHKIRFFRKRKKMTIQNLSEQLKCSPSYISQLEREMSNPSVNTLKKISEVLGVPITSFFDESDNNNDNYVIKKDKGKKLYSTTEKAEFTLLIPDHVKNKFADIYVLEIGPGGKNEILYQNNSEELGYVLEGKIVITLDNKEYELEEGDSIYFPGKIPHGWENKTNKTCKTIWFITPPFL